MPLTNKSPGLCWGALDACWGPAVYTQADSFQFHLNLHSLFLQRLKISQMWDLRNFLGLSWANAEPWVYAHSPIHTWGLLESQEYVSFQAPYGHLISSFPLSFCFCQLTYHLKELQCLKLLWLFLTNINLGKGCSQTGQALSQVK